VKVLHLPTSVGQNAWHLAQGEKALGADSKVLVYESSFLDYSSDIQMNLQATSNAAGKLARLARTFMAIRSKYDIFHFNFGTSLMTSRSRNVHHLDLPFYSDKAKLFVSYNGCDARQKYPTIARGGISACGECQYEPCKSGKLDHSRAEGIRKMSRHVEHMWALNPDLMHFLPADKASFLPYAINMPNHAPQWPSTRGPLKVVHAPTNRDIKGTHYLLEAVERLNAIRQGSIELTLVEGISNEQALRVYREADLVVDQLLIGWYGGFAVEAMLLGKPVVVRIHEDVLKFIPYEMKRDLGESVINANPYNLYDTLVQCLDNRTQLMTVAQAGYEYARKWHSPKHVASLTLERYGAALA
jgi:hypothetical protein